MGPILQPISASDMEELEDHIAKLLNHFQIAIQKISRYGIHLQYYVYLFIYSNVRDVVHLLRQYFLVMLDADAHFTRASCYGLPSFSSSSSWSGCVRTLASHGERVGAGI